MTNPTEKTLKPSDSILHRVNATREPNQRTLTLAGGWEPGDTQSVVIAMLRDLDEQHAAQSSPPRLTEKPFFEGLAERQKRRSECPHGVGLCTASCPSKAVAPPESAPGRREGESLESVGLMIDESRRRVKDLMAAEREGENIGDLGNMVLRSAVPIAEPAPGSREGSCSCMWPVAPDGPYHGVRCPRYRFHAIAQDSIPSADEGAETVARLGINVPKWADEIRAKVASATEAAPLVEPPAPEAGEPADTTCRDWLDGLLDSLSDGLTLEEDGVLLGEDAGLLIESAIKAQLASVVKERDEALARVEQLRAEYVKLTELTKDDAAHKEIRRLEEALVHEIKRHACAELSRHAAWSNSVSAEQARDAALAKVEELQKRLEQAEDDASPGCHLCGRDGDEAPCTEHLCEDCALRWRADLTAATSRAEAAEARVAEMERERPHLVEGCEYVF